MAPISPQTMSSDQNPRSSEASDNTYAPGGTLEDVSPEFTYLDGIADFGTTAWPWLHESLYLQGGPSFPSASDGIVSMPFPAGQISEGDSLHDPRPALSFSVPADGDDQRAGDSLGAIVDDLVAYAASTSSNSTCSADRYTVWSTAALRLETVRPDNSPPSGLPDDAARHLLDSFVNTHMTRFNPLWPLFSQSGFDTGHLHPVSYLTLTSIGAMYGSLEDRRYGTLMHERLRRLLTAALFDLEGGQDDLVWLSQARLLTQVAALYFGQKQAFSYAQHLGAILVAQARRMDLFGKAKHPAAFTRAPLTASAERSLWTWAEQRRRLAFGILRGDVYTSILLGTRPYLTYEEFKISLPRSDSLWHNKECLVEEQLVVAQQFEDDRAQLCFADLVQIALERHEDLPELTAVGYEMCLFGLQGLVWSFSQDTDFLHQIKESYCSSTARTIQPGQISHVDRPTSSGNVASPGFLISAYSDIGLDALAVTPRDMGDLKSDYSRIVGALHVWHRNMRRARPDSKRDTRMSSMLLYHISHLQLFAPLQDLHRISYASMEERSADYIILNSVRRWINSQQASLALSHAWSIWLLVRDEHLREVHERSRFNFLAFCGLHHSAVVLWTFHASLSESSHKNPPFRLDVRLWLLECADMFDALSPLGGISFGTAARKLANRPFPERSGTDS